MVVVRTRFSVAVPLRFEREGLLYLVVGTSERSKARVVALAEAHGSVISTRANWCWSVPVDVPKGGEAVYLYDTVAHLVAARLVGMAAPGSTILVHEANDWIRAAVFSCADAAGVQAVFVASGKGAGQEPSDVISVHEMTSARSLAKLLPLKDISVAARFDRDCTSSGACDGGVWSRLASLLPAHARRETFSSLLSAPVSIFSTMGPGPRSGSASLEKARTQSGFISAGVLPDDVVVGVKSLAGSDQSLKVVDWTQSRHVSVKVQPASSLVTLSPNKTYLLVGMTGDLGRSVCQWMVGRGAKHVVLTSRKPKIESWWVDEMKSLGAQVHAMAM